MRTLDVEVFKIELAKLLWKHNAYLGVDINGDTQGLRTNFVVGINALSMKKTVLSEGNSYLSASDLASREELEAADASNKQEVEKLKNQVDILSGSWASAIKNCVDAEFAIEKLDATLNWLLGRLHVTPTIPVDCVSPTQDVWKMVSFAAPHWDCNKKGPHDMRQIVALAMGGAQ